MTPEQIQAFYDGAGIHADHFNFLLRLTAGLMKLLEDGHIHHYLRFIVYLVSLAATLMLFFTFISY